MYTPPLPICPANCASAHCCSGGMFRRDRIAQPVQQAHILRQHIQRERPGPDCLDHLLLPFAAREIAVAVARARIFQGALAVQVLAARRELHSM